MNSGHQVLVIPIVLEPHPNADTLSIVRVDGYTVIVKTDEWKDRAIGAYIPPDNVVPDTDQFAFLGGHRRIKVRKFRKIISHGLLIEAPKGSKIGEDIAQKMGIVHYEPPMKNQPGFRGEQKKPPFEGIPEYDLEHWRKYGSEFIPGEEIVITEKIHGTNARFCFHEGKFHVGSHHVWRRSKEEYEEKYKIQAFLKVRSFRDLRRTFKNVFFRKPLDEFQDIYWRILNTNPWIQDVCKSIPSCVIFGEIYGDVQDLTYGHENGQLSFRIFDIWSPRTGYYSFDALFITAATTTGIDTERFVPVLYRGPYSEEKCLELYQGKSVIPNTTHIKEGIAIRTTVERQSDKCGRMHLKLVSDEYLERAK